MPHLLTLPMPWGCKDKKLPGNCNCLGLGSPPKRKAGRHSRQHLWEKAFSTALGKHCMQTKLRMRPITNETQAPARKKRKQKVTVPDLAKIWFFVWSTTRMNVGQWTMQQCLRTAANSAPEIFGNLDAFSVYQWKLPEPAMSSLKRRGRKCKLNPTLTAKLTTILHSHSRFSLTVRRVRKLFQKDCAADHLIMKFIYGWTMGFFH